VRLLHQQGRDEGYWCSKGQHFPRFHLGESLLHQSLPESEAVG
jgi:hypothetical protein